MKISICVPVYNAEHTIAALVTRIEEVLPHADLDFVLVNDGSRDDSEKICKEIASGNPRVTFVSLRKNSGEHNAVMCALNFARGDYAVIIDDDFQNPPEEIIKLIHEAEKGYDVVYSKFQDKRHHALRNLGSKLNDVVATWLLEKPKDLYLSSFKVIKREVVDEVIKYKGPFPYIDGLILRSTSHISSVEVRHADRKFGKSNYTLAKLISLWLNMFVNFSIKPLRAFTLAGLALFVLSMFMIVWFVVEKLVFHEQNFGWTSIMSAVTFFAGTQLMFLGLMAEYLGKQYLTISQTPQWTIKSITSAAVRPSHKQLPCGSQLPYAAGPKHWNTESIGI